jgi:hypothetical protein
MRGMQSCSRRQPPGLADDVSRHLPIISPSTWRQCHALARWQRGLQEHAVAADVEGGCQGFPAREGTCCSALSAADMVVLLLPAGINSTLATECLLAGEAWAPDQVNSPPVLLWD